MLDLIAFHKNTSQIRGKAGKYIDSGVENNGFSLDSFSVLCKVQHLSGKKVTDGEGDGRNPEESQVSEDAKGGDKKRIKTEDKR